MGLVCLAGLVVFCASHIFTIWWTVRRYDSAARTWGLGNGTVGVVWTTGPLPATFHQPPPKWMVGRRTGPMFWWQFRDSPMAGLSVVTVPLWIPSLTACLLAVGLLWPDLARIYRHREACRACGYDRRGLVGVGAACPECGSKP